MTPPELKLVPSGAPVLGQDRMRISLDQVPGNAETVALLERYLTEARSGDVNAAAVIITRGASPNAQVKASYVGPFDNHPVLKKHCILLAKKIRDEQSNISPPQRLEYADASHAVYNMARGSANYDFIPWLIEREQDRLRAKLDGPLKVHFWFGKDGKTGLMNSFRRLMFDNVIRPSLAFVGAVEDARASQGKCVEFYLNREIVKNCTLGETVPKLVPNKPLLDWPNLITITLRESDEWPHRNSNVDAWARFARDLEAAGWDVVFVRDTAKAFEPFFTFNTYPAASINIQDRLALYESASANLFVSNGPFYLALWGTRPFLAFHELCDEDHGYECNKPSFWKHGQGIEQGSQYPWSGPQQRIVWAKDDYPEIITAWESLGLEKTDGSMEAQRQALS